MRHLILYTWKIYFKIQKLQIQTIKDGDKYLSEKVKLSEVMWYKTPTQNVQLSEHHSKRLRKKYRTTFINTKKM